MTKKFKRRSFIKTNAAFMMGIGAWRSGPAALLRTLNQEMVLVEKGRSLVPVILGSEPGEATERAAKDLATYIGKISGARMQVADGRSVPERAIWIGIRPELGRLFPDVDLEFNHPEEILIACNGKHLLIAGRDRFFKGTQIEFGTANAVYTFLHKYLDVRWLWPGELGEDIPTRDTITLPAFEYRFHPVFLGRKNVFIKAERRGLADDWTRYQRLKLDSLKGPTGGHAFTDWWDRFHEEHPDWFALQPDGTRSGYPDPRTVKMCLSNPGVWEQWTRDAVRDIQKNPALNMLNAAENDNHSSGLCVCEKCRSWDHPEGHPWTFRWEGHKEEYVATTDRDITFWNKLAQKLKARFPGRDNLYVRGGAYGPTTPPPVEAVPDNQVIIGYVGKFPTIDEETRKQQKEQIRAWSEKAPNLFYRPNLWYWTGGVWGLPDIALGNVLEDFPFLAENSCIGLFFDSAQEHWSTQGPQYYLMAQLAWDPLQDGEAVLDDYYRRGFGGAADTIRSYWELLEQGFMKTIASKGFGPHGSYRYRLLEIFEEVYTEDFFDRAYRLIRRAGEQVKDGPQKYRDRVRFVRAGLELTRLMVRNIPLMTRVRESGEKDKEALREVSRNWKRIEKLHKDAGPVAINYNSLLGKMQGTGYQGNMEDYFGPPADKFIKGTAGGKGEKTRDEPTDID